MLAVLTCKSIMLVALPEALFVKFANIPVGLPVVFHVWFILNAEKASEPVTEGALIVSSIELSVVENTCTPLLTKILSVPLVLGGVITTAAVPCTSRV